MKKQQIKYGLAEIPKFCLDLNDNNNTFIHYSWKHVLNNIKINPKYEQKQAQKIDN